MDLSLSLGAVSNSDVGGHGFPLFSVPCSFDDLDFTDDTTIIYGYIHILLIMYVYNCRKRHYSVFMIKGQTPLREMNTK